MSVETALQRVLAAVNRHVPALHPYVPGKQPTGDDWVKLNTNELPYPSSPRVADAVAAEVAQLRKYPAPTSAGLRAELAALHGVDPAQVIVGNGSDEILTLLVRAFAGPERRVGQVSPSYSLYPVLAAIQDTTCATVELAPDLALPIDRIHQTDTPLFFLTTPNAPFGIDFGRAAVRAAVDGFNGVFVADEAYADFGEWSALELLADCPHLVVTRSLSKSYGLAGLRVGYAVASAELIALLDRVRDSYNVNRLSQAGALAAVRDQAYLHAVVARVRATRTRFSEALRAQGWEVLPSQTNFVFARPPGEAGRPPDPASAAAAFAHLEQEHILVRYFPGSPLTANGLRISIGTDSEMDRCLETLIAWQTHA